MIAEPVDVLAVDDNPTNLLALENLLAHLGVNLVKAHSGDEALRNILERDFAVVLLDIQMPGLSGFDTARLIRTRERSRHMPIIFLTAFSHDQEQVERGYELGAVDFLFKPIVPAILQSKVGVFLDLHRKAREIIRQAELLQQAAAREHERSLNDARRKWEHERLLSEMEQERRVAAERDQLVRELQKAAAELQEADKRKDEFLAMLAHELRNPLAPIVTALGLVGRQVDDPRLGKSIGAAERQAHHMSALIRDLLDVSRINQGKIGLHREHVSLGGIVQQALDTAAPAVTSKKQEMQVTLPPSDVSLDVDPTRMTQILANLLHNASKYSGEGGRIDLSCGVEGDELVVVIEDDGVGIPNEKLEKIFDSFIQLDSSADRGTGGLGLGLTLVRRLAELHGGGVTAESEGPGKGARFTVRLPVVVTIDRNPATGDSKEIDVAPRRILLVEDNEDIRLTLRDLLEFEGHEVEEAADGPRGAAKIVEMRPNVAFVDIGLPGLDGYGVAQQVRAQAANDVRLVALTGYGGEEVSRKVKEAGFDAHLIKPVRVEELFRVIGELG